jgi:hypothetical protein
VWKYIPRAFEVSYLVDKVWKTVRHNHENTSLETNIVFLPKVIAGLKIKVIENDPIYGLFKNAPIFGISHLNVKREFFSLSLNDCGDGEEKQSNRWTLEDVERVDNKTKKALTQAQTE